MTIHANFGMIDMRESYVVLVKELIRNGSKVMVRGQHTYEMIDVMLNFTVPGRDMLPLNIGRKINKRLAAVEALSVIAGTAEFQMTMAAAPSYNKVLVSKDPNDFYYAAYGPRIVPAFDTVADQLSKDPTSRQAVLSIWRRDDLFHRGDKPCTLNIQFLIRQERLHMIVNMRSNDVWFGLAYDAFVFNQVHWTMLHQLKKTYPQLQFGEYRHHAASLHLYERDVPAARELYAPIEVPKLALPHGVICPQSFYPDQVAHQLLHPVPDRPLDIAVVERLNPWYAEQISAIDEMKEVRS